MNDKKVIAAMREASRRVILMTSRKILNEEGEEFETMDMVQVVHCILMEDIPYA